MFQINMLIYNMFQCLGENSIMTHLVVFLNDFFVVVYLTATLIDW